MRRKLIYGILAILWLTIAGWQALEHQRLQENARRALTSRAHDLSAALSVVIRSQGRVAFIPRPRLEAALDELVDSTELKSVVLLNAAGEIAAAAGQSMPVEANTLLRTHEYWNEDTASFANLVALGSGTEGDEERAAILPLDMPQRERPPEDPAKLGDITDPTVLLKHPLFDSIIEESSRQKLLQMMGDRPLTEADVTQILGLFKGDAINQHREETLRRTLTGRPLDRALLEEMLIMVFTAAHPPGPPPERPPWMNKNEYEQLVEKHGVHWFLVTMPTETLHTDMADDLRLRGVVLGGALLACLALGLAWHTSVRSSNLQIQLVRAQETATRLQELNVTAAGLVHETKNPLNLIRGLAQTMLRESGIPDGLRDTAVKITEEADRVAGRLNQFLSYARPAQPIPKEIDLKVLVEAVFGVLAFDQEEKSVHFSVAGPALCIKADEEMLRQLLFNLLINSVQAVSDGGKVEVILGRDTDHAACIEVRDDGPGVPPERCEAIFRPYFTTSENGTGLGLAVVRQIALSHHWQVECLPMDSGALFRIRHIALSQGKNEENLRG